LTQHEKDLFRKVKSPSPQGQLEPGETTVVPLGGSLFRFSTEKAIEWPSGLRYNANGIPA
jgi:hypothetical protein